MNKAVVKLGVFFSLVLALALWSCSEDFAPANSLISLTCPATLSTTFKGSTGNLRGIAVTVKTADQPVGPVKGIGVRVSASGNSIGGTFPFQLQDGFGNVLPSNFFAQSNDNGVVTVDIVNCPGAVPPFICGVNFDLMNGTANCNVQLLVDGGT